MSHKREAIKNFVAISMSCVYFRKILIQLGLSLMFERRSAVTRFRPADITIISNTGAFHRCDNLLSIWLLLGNGAISEVAKEFCCPFIDQFSSNTINHFTTSPSKSKNITFSDSSFSICAWVIRQGRNNVPWVIFFPSAIREIALLDAVSVLGGFSLASADGFVWHCHRCCLVLPLSFRKVLQTSLAGSSNLRSPSKPSKAVA